MQNYTEARELLDRPGTRNNSRKLANNTYLEDRGDYLAVVLHGTDVVELHPAYFVLNSGGFRTLTTKDRMNRFSPAQIWQHNFVWYMPGDIVYTDNIKLDYDCKPLNNEGNQDIVKDTATINKKIKRFVTDAVAELQKGMPLPSGSDCWYCYLKTGDGETMGDLDIGGNHLFNHIKDNYFVPSLIYNAVREARYQHPLTIISGWQGKSIADQSKMGGDGCMVDDVKRALRRYLQKRLLSL